MLGILVFRFYLTINSTIRIHLVLNSLLFGIHVTFIDYKSIWTQVSTGGGFIVYIEYVPWLFKMYCQL